MGIAPREESGERREEGVATEGKQKISGNRASGGERREERGGSIIWKSV
jgi:hypothetical protein